MIEIIDDEKFKAQIFDLEKDEPLPGIRPTIIIFFATWCGPCMQFAPVLEKIALDFKDRVDFFKMDIDLSPEVPAEFSIRSVPHTLFIAPGKESVLVGGGAGEEKMRRAILELFGIPL